MVVASNASFARATNVVKLKLGCRFEVCQDRWLSPIQRLIRQYTREHSATMSSSVSLTLN